MARTQIKGTQVLDGTIKRVDLNVDDSGNAVISKVVQGTGISIESTGADAGTGDVTVNVADEFIRQDGTKAFSSDQSMGNNKLINLSYPEGSGDAVNKEYVDEVIGAVDKFEYDGNDLMPTAVESKFIFEFDDNNDLMFTVSGATDTDFELDGSLDIMPKA